MISIRTSTFSSGRRLASLWLAATLAVTLPLPAAAQSPGHTFSVLSPYTSVARSRQLLDTAVLRIALELDYSEEGAGARERKAAILPGVKSARFIAKPAAGGARVLELALASYPAGGYQVYIYGFESVGSERVPNPDLQAAESIFTRLLSELGQTQAAAGVAKFGDSDNRYASYKLSYVQSDRATALLKVLGYSVIEFQAPTKANPLVYDEIYATASAAGEVKLPVVIRLIDSAKTSLLQPAAKAAGSRPAPSSSSRGGKAGGALNLGGLFLDQITSGGPQQRLMIVYDGKDPEAMQVLVNLLRDEIDIPAQQILIEALVIELDRDKLRDVGVDFDGSKDGSSLSFITDNAGFASPFTYSFGRPSLKSLFEFDVTLKALVTSGNAQVLSRPSVLVLDGRQARIQVGEKIPFTSNISATNTGTLSSTDYLTTGIVLNLRPRISHDGSEITMQVETLISSAGSSGFIAESGVLVAPPIQSREVQTLVRVANNTPFVIGGLISTTQQTNVSGVPGLSKIPGLGVLFRKKTKNDVQKEVIVVITPHVMPLEDRTFSYAIPKDAEIFDSFGKGVFRNIYRIRSSDIFDLSFVYESRALLNLQERVREQAHIEPAMRVEEPYRSLLEGGVPGEEYLVMRMLWEVVRKKGFADLINPERIIFYPDEAISSGLDVSFLSANQKARGKSGNSLALTFDRVAVTSMEQPFDPPRAVASTETVAVEGFLNRLREGNQRREDGTWQRNTILLHDDWTTASGVSADETLRSVLVLKRLLELNADLPLTLKGYHVGVEVVFPSEDDLRKRYHLVDRKAAQLFYELLDYYLVFERQFTRRTREILESLGGGATAALGPGEPLVIEPAGQPQGSPVAPAAGSPAPILPGSAEAMALEPPAAVPPVVADPPRRARTGRSRVVAESAAPCLNFRLEPGTGPPVKTCLPPGTRIEVSGREGDWSRVVLANGREGWMSSAFLTPAGPTG